MTEELNLKYLKRWKRCSGVLLYQCTMLVLGTFCGYMAERVKAKVVVTTQIMMQRETFKNVKERKQRNDTESSRTRQ